PQTAREPLPGRAAGLGGHWGGARGAEGEDRRAIRIPLRDGAAAAPVRRGRPPVRAVRPRRADRVPRGHARRRPRRRQAPAPRPAPVGAVSDRRGGPPGARLIELPIRRLREEAVIPARAYSGDAGLDLSACERVVLGPGERALVPTGIAVAIPDGYAGYVQPR